MVNAQMKLKEHRREEKWTLQSFFLQREAWHNIKVPYKDPAASDLLHPMNYKNNLWDTECDSNSHLISPAKD